jgi:hypothetical protein
MDACKTFDKLFRTPSKMSNEVAKDSFLLLCQILKHEFHNMPFDEELHNQQISHGIHAPSNIFTSIFVVPLVGISISDYFYSR